MDAKADTTQKDRTAGGEPPAVERSDPPIYQVALWPNLSLGRRGYRFVMGGAAAMLSLPLLGSVTVTLHSMTSPGAAVAVLSCRVLDTDAKTVLVVRLLHT